MSFRKLVKYELLNMLRSRWLLGFAVSVAALSAAFIRISGSFDKAVLALSSVLTVLVPLLASLFAVVYGYSSERFTELLLTLPMRRDRLFRARWLALCVSLSGALVVGVVPVFAAVGGLDRGVLLLAGGTVFLCVVFATLGLGIAVAILDRMKGIGAALGVWLYFAILHDGLILLVLLAMRDYPMDVPAGVLAALSPVGMVRVLQVLLYDAAMLLSYSGALARGLLSGAGGAAIAAALAALWLGVPFLLAQRTFERKDY